MCNDTGQNAGNGTTCGTNKQCETGACCGIYEICNNGIDDNCDGKVDCADPQCTTPDAGGNDGQWQCTDLPSGNGWTIVAYDPSQRVTCPSLYATSPNDVVSAISASPDSCSSTPHLTQAASCAGYWNWCAGGTTCCAPPTSGTAERISWANGKPTCFTSTSPINNFASTLTFVGRSTTLSTTAGVCSCSSAVTTKPAVSDTQGETCSLTQPGSCPSAGNACVPIVPSGFKMCSMYSGATTCPTGLFSYTVYTGYSDTRGCSGCASAGSTNLACAIATNSNDTGVTYWSGQNCAGSAETMPEGSQPCLHMSFQYPYSYYGEIVNNGTANNCTVSTSSTATGGVTGTGQTTLCCTN